MSADDPLTRLLGWISDRADDARKAIERGDPDAALDAVIAIQERLADEGPGSAEVGR